ncbi:MAG: hypothetical protein P4L22_01865 [Candidatus Babeliales bacterium]|nr:hypothetical protein [Candidatus Babeliales bacterium]
MNKFKYLSHSFIFLILGTIFFGIQNDFIIFRWPTKTIAFKEDNNLATKKRIKLFYWNNNKWINETTTILVSANLQDNVQHILNSWLNLLDEEKIIEKIFLQTALISEASNELFLSFDRNLLIEDHSTYQKLMLIEGLLKTLRENDIKVPKIYFLVYHKPMQDSHLDFSNTWPLEGFFKN